MEKLLKDAEILAKKLKKCECNIRSINTGKLVRGSDIVEELIANLKNTISPNY